MNWLLAAAVVALLLVPAAQAAPWDGVDPADVTFSLITADPGRDDGAAWYGHSGFYVEANGTSNYYAYRLHIEDSPLRPFKTAFTDVPFSLHERTLDARLAEYVEQERSVRSMQLILSPSEKGELIGLLQSELDRRDTPRLYQVIDENCSTRLRDMLDLVWGGPLAAATSGPSGFTVRDMGRQYIEHDPIQGSFIYTLVGPRGDEPITVWDSMYMPLELEANLLANGHALAPQTLLEFGEPAPGPGHARMLWLNISIGLLAGAAVIGAGYLRRRGDAGASRQLSWCMVLVGIVAVIPAIMTTSSWLGVMASLWQNNLNLLLISPITVLWLLVGLGRLRNAAWADAAARRLSVVGALLALTALSLHGLGVQNMEMTLAGWLPVHLAIAWAANVRAVPAGSAPRQTAA